MRSIIQLFSIFILIWASATASADDLLLHYNFDQDDGAIVLDQGPNNYTGTLHGAVWTDTGFSGGAMTFDGSARVEAGDVLDLGEVSDEFTVCAWVQIPTNIPSNGIDSTLWIVGNNLTNSPYTGWRLNVETGSGLADLITEDGRAKTLGNGEVLDGAWHLLCGIYQATPTSLITQVYHDGVLDNETTQVGTFSSPTNDASLRMGAWKEDGTMGFIGAIDELQIFGRAFSEPEILIHYARGIGMPLMETDPALFDLQVPVGLPAPDQTLRFRNNGGGTLVVTAATETAWIQLDPPGGSSTGEWTEISVQIDTTDMTPGSYQGQVLIGPADKLVELVAIPVNLEVTPAVIQALPAPLTISTRWGYPVPDQEITIRNNADGIMPFTIEDDAAWVSLSREEGVSTGEWQRIMVSIDSSGFRPGQASATLTVRSDAAANSPLQIPLQLSITGSQTPNGEALNTRRPLLQWVEAENAEWYQVWIGRDGSQYLNQWLHQTDPFWVVSKELACGNYDWYVRSRTASGRTSAWTGPASFSIACCSPGDLTALASSGCPGACGNINYQWQGDPCATWYQLFIQRNGASFYSKWGYTGAQAETVTRSVPGHSFGSYQWWVRGWNPDGIGPWSGPFDLHIGRLELTGLTPDTVTWNPACEADATWFRIYIAQDGREYWSEWVPGIDAVGGSTTLPITLPDGTYKVWIQTYSPVCGYGPWSEPLEKVLP